MKNLKVKATKKIHKYMIKVTCNRNLTTKAYSWTHNFLMIAL